MNKILNIYKPIGKTPLEMIQLLKQNYPEYQDQKITYAGRLDPMAEGVLILLVGEAVHLREEYLGLDKEYIFEVLFGLRTDTYDILGLVDESFCHPGTVSIRSWKLRKNGLIRDLPLLNQQINHIIPSFLGIQNQPYPPFSSQPVKGKPLWWWAREEKLSEIEVPTHSISVFDLELLEVNAVTATDLRAEILPKIDLVSGNFRQAEIKERWIRLLGKTNQSFPTAKFRIYCSSGTYVRQIAYELGQKLGIGALALSIVRTRVGELRSEDSIKF